MREMKDSGVKSIGEIPACWCTRKFKTLAKLCNGREVGSDEGTIPVYGSGGVFKHTDKPLHSGESLLLGRKGTIDNPMIVNGEFWTVDTMFYTSEFHNVLGKYMYYCFKGAVDYGFYKSGSVLPSMTQTEINGIFLPYPPLPEQRRIADYLDTACGKVDALIANQQSQIEKLKAYKQSLITEVVTHGLDPNVPMKDSGVKWIGMIPEGWEESRIKYIALFDPKCSTEQLTPDSIIGYAPMECIKNGYFIPKEARYGDVSTSLTSFEDGDIVIAKVTPCFENGNIAIMDNLPSGYGLGSSELFVLRAKQVNTKYLLYWLQNTRFINAGQSTMTGTGGLKRVSPNFIKSCCIYFPSEPEQQQIADYLNDKCAKIDTLIAIKQQKIEKLTEYKKSLIYEYVTGKKEVV